MKTIVILATIVVFLATGAIAQDKDKPPPKAQCPKTQMMEDCLKCHVIGNFKVRETRPDAHLSYPNSKTKILNKNGEKYGYFFLTNILADEVREYFDYLREHKIKSATIEISSPGGGLFEGLRIVSLMTQWQAEGNTIETRCLSFAASAGFLVFVAGDKGKRFISPEAQLMWHELWTFKMFSLETPSSTEEQSRILRHIQNTLNHWIVTRGKLKKDDLDEKIRGIKELWMSGQQAKEVFGFADGYI